MPEVYTAAMVVLIMGN